MKKRIPLERAAAQVCDAASKPPFIFQLPPEQGRRHLDAAQDSPVYKFPAEVRTIQVQTGAWGSINVHCVRPENMSAQPNIIFYIHGAGWVFGNLHTHNKLVKELGARTNSIVVFPEYSLSPEAKFPIAVEQCYATLSNLLDIVRNVGLEANLNTLTVAGDSVGGNMAAVMTLLSKIRHGPPIHKQLLYYPVTNAFFNTPSYREFATDYYLYRAGMIWFWNQYTTLDKDRNMILSSPLRASLEQLCGLPDAMIITGQADVLRDEGEAYAAKLLSAGVDVTAVRFNAIIHDFVMLNALDQTNACRGAMDISTDWINKKNRGLLKSFNP